MKRAVAASEDNEVDVVVAPETEDAAERNREW